MKVVLIFLLTLVILAGAQISLARPQYLTSLSTLYDNVSCSTCHVNGNSDGPRTSYGTLFENQPSYKNDPIAAMKVIGAPPTATTITPSTTDTLTATMTPEITKEISDEEENQEEGGTETKDEIETPAETAAPAVTTIKDTGTPTTSGFGIVTAIVGLFACSLMVKRNNKVKK